MTYRAPIKDMLFCMKELAGLDEIAKLPGFEDAGFDTAQAVLEECAKFNEEVVAPLNVEGDRSPSYWKDGQVFTTPGFKEAFRRFGEGELRPEQQHLFPGSECEFLSTEAAREPEIVTYQRARSSLPSDRFAFNNDRP